MELPALVLSKRPWSLKSIGATLPLLIVALGVAPTSLAQVVSATLTGNVSDSSGASVPSASVKVTEQSTGTVNSTQTTVEGVYNLPFLSPGTYKLEIEARGFKRFSQDNILLKVST